jgi:hypothetical protein
MARVKHPVRTVVRLVIVLLAMVLLATAYYSKQSPSTVARQWATDIHVLHANNGVATSYALESTYGPNSSPTRWVACSTIRYEVNLTDAPSNALTVLSTNLARIHSLTGLTFVYAGPTSVTDYSTYDESGAIAPVIFAWAPSSQMLGQTNVNAVTVPIVNPSHANYTSGVVLFNDDMNAAFTTNPQFADSLVLHEAGHVVGLADVNDASQVMNATLTPSSASSTLGAGDIAGLHVLGSSSCE